MKKVKLVFVWGLFVIFIFSSCSYDTNYKTPEQKAKQQSADIIKCFENEDIEGLKGMFCKTIADSHDLDEEIQKAFNVIDGTIISYDEPYGNTGGGTIKYGERIEQSFLGNIKNIKTNKEKTYKIVFESYSIYKENKNNVGIYSIIIISDNLNKYQIGEFIE